MSELYLGTETEWSLDVTLPEELHRQAIYLLGRSGFGKSTLMANLAVQFHAMGEGVLVIDIKDGKLTDEIAARCPDPDNTIYFAPGLCRWDDQRHFWGLNVLEYPRQGDAPTEDAAEQVVSGVVSMFERMARASPEFMTRVRTNLTNAVRVAIARPEATLLDIEQMLMDRGNRMARLTSPAPPQAIRYWRKFEAAHRSEKDQFQGLSSTFSRIKEITDPPLLNFMVSQPHTTLRLEEWLDAGKLVLCNLAAGITEAHRELLGNLVMALAVNAAFRRSRVEEENKRVWRYLVDEFDVLAPDQFADLIDKARSFRVFPVMAHQNKGQLTKGRAKDSRLFDAASSVPVTFTFSIGDEDRRHVTFIRGAERAEQLAELPKYTALLDVAGSPPDAGFPLSVELPNWWAERDEEQLARLIDAQRAHTRPKREIVSRNRERYYAEVQDGTSREYETRSRHPRIHQEAPSQPPQSFQRPDQNPPPVEDRASERDPEATRPAPVRFQRPDRDAPV